MQEPRPPHSVRLPVGEMPIAALTVYRMPASAQGPSMVDHSKFLLALGQEDVQFWGF